MRKLFNLGIVAVLALLLAGALTACAGPVKNLKQLESSTDGMRGIIQSKLSNLNNAVSDATKKIAVSGLKGEETRSILNALCKKYPYLLDCATSDANGKLITVAPEEYRRLEGTESITSGEAREFQDAFRENKKPVFTNMFRSVEGVDAVVLVWPVVSEKGEFMGAVNALFIPETLLKGTIAPAAEVRAMEVEVLQVDGLVIYNTRGADAGKNLLTGAEFKAYTELVSLGAKIAAQQTGSGTYIFPSHTTGQPAKKTAFWTSVGLHGTYWRIMSIAELDK